MSILIIFIVLSFLVIIHELGHFLTARWAKIKVEEFGLGFPPVAKTLRIDKWGTAYTLNWLPFGGFVRMLGEDGGDLQKGSFASAPVGKRLIVVLAGATVNFIFGVIAFGAIYSRFGIPTPLQGAKIEAVVPDSPAAAANIPANFVVHKVVSAQNEEKTITTSQQFISFVSQHRGETITLENNSGESYSVYVRRTEETPQGQGSLGVALVDYEVNRYPWYEMPFRGMWVGLKTAVNFGGLILTSLGNMIRDLFTQGTVPQDVAGLVGIAYSAQKEGFLNEGFWAILNFMAILSINLAIMNVLPFPALDGGRGFLLLIEMIVGKRVNPKFEQYLNTAGFAALISLIILISFRDVVRVIRDPAVQQWFQNIGK